ncbi:MAG: DUF4954 family protein [Alistipes sp.]|nr:DUF4954 family protein [Candidatus Alistipes equi]
MQLRNLTQCEIDILERNGNYAENWSGIFVSPLFECSQIRGSELRGKVCIHDGVRIIRSCVENCIFSQGCLVDNVGIISCRRESTFGIGTFVSSVNECAGRNIPLSVSLTAQSAYLMTMFRNHPRMVQRLQEDIEREATNCRSDMCFVGKNSVIRNCRVIYEVRLGEGCEVDGASHLQNGTILSGAKIGADVKASSFVFAENCVVSNGAIVDHAFVGESTEVTNGFTLVQSLVFSNCDLENGEACATFMGPFTVSHHKSSLLIAGMFSFFNAGSGTNQSNHLFKDGAVHQSIHMRGCKFSSNGYVMSPAVEGAFSMVMGRNVKHHDTSEMPFSYLIESNGITTLVPAIAIYGYGTQRDMQKWPKRDKRTIKRDVINFEEYNPFLTYYVKKGIELLRDMLRENPDLDVFHFNGCTIKRGMAERGAKIYEKYLTVALGEMLKKGSGECGKFQKWVDLAGQFVSLDDVTKLISDVENGTISTLQELNKYFVELSKSYENDSYAFAWNLLGNILGHEVTQKDVQEAIASSNDAVRFIQQIRESDLERDRALDMQVGYGLDLETKEEKLEEFKAVRGLK